MTENQYTAFLDNLYEGVYYVDKYMKIKYWSKSAELITGFSSSELIGQKCEKILTHTNLEGQTLCETGCLCRDTLINGSYYQTEAYLRHKKGHLIQVSVKVSPMYDMKNNLIGAIQVFTNNDFYLRRRDDSEDESYALYYDKLTKLPTKYNMKLKIKNKIQEYRRYGWTFGLFLLEIDHFEELSNRLDTHKMEKLVTDIADLLKKDLRPFDILSHWEKNQFVVLLVNIKKEHLTMLGERLRNLIKKKGLITSIKNTEPSFSIGGTLVSEGITLEELIEKITKFCHASHDKNGDCVTTSW